MPNLLYSHRGQAREKCDIISNALKTLVMKLEACFARNAAICRNVNIIKIEAEARNRRVRIEAENATGDVVTLLLS